jgi:hypothetical protein
MRKIDQTICPVCSKKGAYYYNFRIDDCFVERDYQCRECNAGWVMTFELVCRVS